MHDTVYHIHPPILLAHVQVQHT